jgi:short-subunit dehydrogenase
MNTKDLSNKLAVITGGSSGIGFAVAERLAERGARLLLVARDQAKLQSAAEKLGLRGAEVHTLSADVSNASDMKRLQDTVAQLAACADIVINSAGVVSAGLLHDTPIEEWDRLHNINVRGLVQGLQALVPAMIKQAKVDGQQRSIVNIASAAGIVGMPGMSAYCATKAAVIALSDSLRIELDRYQIGVSTVCPGFVQTPIAETVQLFGRMNTPKTAKSIKRMFASGKLMPERVADQTLIAIHKNKGLIVIGREAIAGHWLKRLSPRLLSSFVAKSMGS